MPVEYKIHSTPKRAIAIVGVALVIGLAASAIRKENPSSVEVKIDRNSSELIQGNLLLLPIVPLVVADASLEAGWSAELAEYIDGQTEVVIQNGRVDVLSEHFAVEVDRLDKWHEGIGQALHYGMATKRTPCLALIVASDDWPLSHSTIAKIRTIETTALGSGVKLIILRRVTIGEIEAR